MKIILKEHDKYFYLPYIFACVSKIMSSSTMINNNLLSNNYNILGYCGVFNINEC